MREESGRASGTNWWIASRDAQGLPLETEINLKTGGKVKASPKVSNGASPAARVVRRKDVPLNKFLRIS